MNDFAWIGDKTILYKGRLCNLTSEDGWEVVNAMNRIDEEDRKIREQLKKEIIKDINNNKHEKGKRKEE